MQQPKTLNFSESLSKYINICMFLIIKPIQSPQVGRWRLSDTTFLLLSFLFLRKRKKKGLPFELLDGFSYFKSLNGCKCCALLNYCGGARPPGPPSLCPWLWLNRTSFEKPAFALTHQDWLWLKSTGSDSRVLTLTEQEWLWLNRTWSDSTELAMTQHYWLWPNSSG